MDDALIGVLGGVLLSEPRPRNGSCHTLSHVTPPGTGVRSIVIDDKRVARAVPGYQSRASRIGHDQPMLPTHAVAPRPTVAGQLGYGRVQTP